MAALTTGSLILQDEILDPWLGKVKGGSVVAALSNSIPMKFGTGHSMTFDIGEAEYVGEGANKGASTITPTTVTTAPFKFHKTVRWTDEVMYADEDQQLNVVKQGRTAISSWDDLAIAALSFSSILSLPYAIENLIPLLSKASKKS